MSIDCFGLELPAANQAAMQAFNRGQEAFLQHRCGSLDHLQEATRLDPGFVAAHAVAGLLQVMQARADTMQQAQQALRMAQRALENRAAQGMEAALVASLSAACEGRWGKASTILQDTLDKNHPHPLLIKIAHMFRFMTGDAAGMMSLTLPYVDAGFDQTAGYGFVLGCHAFALEENGLFEEAEPVAQRALHLEQEDVWAMHALAHVYETAHRTGEGLLWVESGRQQWSGCNNFANHMSWHLALFCLDRGKFDRAVAIYDDDLCASQTDDFRDFANAVSLLLRLRQMGVDTSGRLEALYDEARKRAKDVTYIFASLHNLVPLLARKDYDSARELIAAMQGMGEDVAPEQAHVARRLGIPLAEAMLAVADGPAKVGNLLKLAEELPMLGGSFVQRDMFLRTLILMADDVCDHKTTSSLINFRHRQRREDGFSKLIEQRICFGGSSADMVHVA